MPRISRGLANEQIYHIINRGNRRSVVFHDEYDFSKMLELLDSAKKRFSINIYAYCLMNNHYHLVVYTKFAKSLSTCMQWLGTSYVRYYNKRYKTSGHLWQGRYKSFIVQRDAYLLTLLRYVEANPLRAKIVSDASFYKYSSIHSRLSSYNNILVDKAPIDLPLQWLDYVNDKEKETDIDMIRNSIERQAPLGDEVW